MEKKRELRAGRDFPIWSHLKWGHAERLADALARDFDMWRLSLGDETTAVYSEDRRVVTFRARLVNSPPTFEWSLAFGDCLHNYRSALDALAWAMAHLDGNIPHPRNSKHIYFPIKTTRTEFDREAKSRLASVPRFVLDRMQSVQPYHVQPGQSVEEGIAIILNDLDIQDKHKSALETRIVAADRTSYGITYHPQDRTKWPKPDDKSCPEWVAPGHVITDGEPVVIWRFPEPVEAAEISDLPLRLTVEYGGKLHDVFDLLRLISQQVAATFRIVETGYFDEEHVDAVLRGATGWDADAATASFPQPGSDE